VRYQSEMNNEIARGMNGSRYTSTTQVVVVSRVFRTFGLG
jgi:hypothetical protein